MPQFKKKSQIFPSLVRRYWKNALVEWIFRYALAVYIKHPTNSTNQLGTCSRCATTSETGEPQSSVYCGMLIECLMSSTGGSVAAAPQLFRPSDPALCGSCPLVTPY